MKKLFSVFLAVAMIFSLTIPALATGTQIGSGTQHLEVNSGAAWSLDCYLSIPHDAEFTGKVSIENRDNTDDKDIRVSEPVWSDANQRYDFIAAGTAPAVTETITLHYIINFTDLGKGDSININITVKPAAIATKDTTPPTISYTINPAQPNGLNGWYTSPVSVTFTCSDDTALNLGAVPQNLSYAQDGIYPAATYTVYDAAGNSASVTVPEINIDAKAPVITLNAPLNGAAYYLNQSAIADWGASDATSGIASATGTAASGSPINTGSVGAKTFSVIASDKAGNQAISAASYSVIYKFGGFLQPIYANGTRSTFKQGSNIPVKFQLTDANGNYISTAVANISLKRGTENIAIGASTLFRYDGAGNQYIFNLSTKPFAAGDYTISATLDDGQTYSANITLTTK